MPAFVLLPASPSDLEAVARVQFAACASDPGFPVIFPKGPSLASITHFVQSYEHDMENDPTCHIMIVKEALSGEIASFAIWHFYPPKSPEEIDQEMLVQEFALPADANQEVGNRLIHNGLRKRHEVVASAIGVDIPYICESLQSDVAAVTVFYLTVANQFWQQSVLVQNTRNKGLRLCCLTGEWSAPTTKVSPSTWKELRPAYHSTGNMASRKLQDCHLSSRLGKKVTISTYVWSGSPLGPPIEVPTNKNLTPRIMTPLFKVPDRLKHLFMPRLESSDLFSKPVSLLSFRSAHHSPLLFGVQSHVEIKGNVLDDIIHFFLQVREPRLDQLIDVVQDLRRDVGEQRPVRDATLNDTDLSGFFAGPCGDMVSHNSTNTSIISPDGYRPYMPAARLYAGSISVRIYPPSVGSDAFRRINLFCVSKSISWSKPRNGRRLSKYLSSRRNRCWARLIS